MLCPKHIKKLGIQPKCEIKQAVSLLKQGDLSLAAYYFNLRQMWDEMDHYRTFHPKCSDDIVAYAKHVEEFRIYELLVGLHLDFEQIQVNILAKVLLLSLNEVLYTPTL